jgi:hypothetical protein
VQDLRPILALALVFQSKILICQNCYARQLNTRRGKRAVALWPTGSNIYNFTNKSGKTT